MIIDQIREYIRLGHVNYAIAIATTTLDEIKYSNAATMSDALFRIFDAIGDDNQEFVDAVVEYAEILDRVELHDFHIHHTSTM